MIKQHQLPEQFQNQPHPKQILHNHSSFDQLNEIQKRTLTTRIQQSKKISQQQTTSKAQQLCDKSSFWRHEILRLIFIPILIVLFLLTIALTFKQNNYQTNDYFYSKNIEINRKIRGIVPPLNQTKENIFGEYYIGLIQSFTLQNRRTFEKFKVEMWRNESMRVSEMGRQSDCWALYKLKFYSSTIFVEKIQSFLANQTIGNKTLNFNQNKTKNDLANPQNQLQQNSMTSKEATGKIIKTKIVADLQVTEKEDSKQDILNSSRKKQSILESRPLCSIEKWSKLNQIFYNSHIWTYADGNFYLLQFSQLGDDENKVLIMKMIVQYPNTV